MTMLSAAYDVQVTSSSHLHHELEHRNGYYHTSSIGNDINKVVFGSDGAFFGDYGSATLLAFEEKEDASNNKEGESTAATSTAMINVDSSWSVVSSTSTSVAAVAVVEDDVAQASKVADIVNSINRGEGDDTSIIIGETTSSPSSSSTSATAKTTVIGNDEKAQGVVTEETATTVKGTTMTTTIDTSTTKVDQSIVKENTNGIPNKVGGDNKPDIVIEKEKIVNDFISSSEIAKDDSQQRNNDKARLNSIDRDIEMQEMEERKVRMHQLANERVAADITESKLREEREALDKLLAIRNARQSTIDALRNSI